MPHHFGVLIPSTNTTAEIEYSRLLPPEWQAHYARVATSSVNKTPFSPPQDADVDYQAKLLGTARVEAIFLLQTSASLFAEDYERNWVRFLAWDTPELHGDEFTVVESAEDFVVDDAISGA